MKKTENTGNKQSVKSKLWRLKTGKVFRKDAQKHHSKSTHERTATFCETWVSSICLMAPWGCQETSPLLTSPAPAEAAFALGSSPHLRAHLKLYSKPGQTLLENASHTQLLLGTSPCFILTFPHTYTTTQSSTWPFHTPRGGQQTDPVSPYPLPLTHPSIPK